MILFSLQATSGTNMNERVPHSYVSIEKKKTQKENL